MKLLYCLSVPQVLDLRILKSSHFITPSVDANLTVLYNVFYPSDFFLHFCKRPRLSEPALGFGKATRSAATAEIARDADEPAA